MKEIKRAAIQIQEVFKMLTFQRDSHIFNYRVAGIAIHQNRILLHTTSEQDFWVLPGGRVEFNEVTSDTIIREMKEELGVDVKVERLCYVHELIYEEPDHTVHELGFYYLMQIPENHDILKRDSLFCGLEGEGKLLFQWFSIDELDMVQCYPEFIQRDIHTMQHSSEIKHEVTKKLHQAT